MHLDAIAGAVARAVNGNRACKYAVDLNAYDRHFTNASFAQASAWLVGQFQQAGCVDAEVVELPADGRTRMQDWTMPLAWQCESAELRLVAPGDELLCSRGQEPRCVAQWSGPTPGTVRAELRLLQEGAAYPAGSFVLTGKHPAEIISLARQAMPAAFISDWVYKGYPDHRTMWINALSEEPGLWGVLANQITAPVFMIPPALGQRLRRKLAEGPVTLAGQIHSRVAPGVMTCATAVTEGQYRDQEVVIFAHGYEAGVIDNDSGVAAVVEAATVLGDLIRQGVLPKPRRSIRWLIVNECYGMVGFYTLKAELAKRGVVGLYLDTVGDKSRPDYPFILHRTGAVNPSYANALVQLVFDRMPADRKAEYHWKYEDEIPVADHMITDPMIGINSPWLGRAHEFSAWHSSDDVAGLLDENSMYGAAFLAAVYGYFVASASDEEAVWLAGQMVPLMRQELSERVKPEQTDRRSFWQWALRKAIESAARLAEESAGRLKVAETARQFEAPGDLVVQPTEFEDPQAGKRVPVRNVWGTITFEGLPVQRRSQGSPRWSEQVNNAWYWADGKRSIGEIAQIVSLEMGTPVRKSLPAFFALAQEAGLCQLNQP